MSWEVGQATEMLVLLGILVLAGAIRFYTLGDLPLWYDEAFTYHASQMPTRLLLTTPIDTHPPLFYLAQKVVLLFDESEIALRLLPAIFGMLSIGVIHLIGRRFVNPVCGLVAAAVVATSTIHAEFSQEARSYTLLFLEICVAAYGLLAFLFPNGVAGHGSGREKGGRTGGLVVYGFASLAALYTHNIAAYFVLAFNLAVLMAWWPMRLIDTRSYLLWFAVQVVISVLWSPWLLSTFVVAKHFSWLEQATPRTAVRQLLDVYGASHLAPFQPAYNLAVFGAAVLGMMFAVSKRLFGVVALVGLLVFLVPVMIWLTGYVKPIFMPKTVMACLVGSALGLGLAVSLSPSRVLAAAILALVVTGSLASTVSHFDSRKKEAWNEAVAAVSQGFTEGDGVILSSHHVSMPVYYYLGSSQPAWPVFGWDPKQKALVGLERAFICTVCPDGTFPNRHEVRRFEDLKAAHRSLWVVRSAGDHSHAVQRNLLHSKLQDLGYRSTGEQDFYRVTVDRFDRY